jgi:hypothetical protein
MNAVKYIIIFGDPIKGFNFRGPFDDHQDAADYADVNEPNEYWWVAELDPPDANWLKERYETQGFGKDQAVNPDGTTYDP